jgi:hypothetical protein
MGDGGDFLADSGAEERFRSPVTGTKVGGHLAIRFELKVKWWWVLVGYSKVWRPVASCQSRGKRRERNAGQLGRVAKEEGGASGERAWHVAWWRKGVRRMAGPSRGGAKSVNSNRGAHAWGDRGGPRLGERVEEHEPA